MIVSPHSARRLYFGGDRVYRSDDRGDSWTVVSADLTRSLDPRKIAIMGKLWPSDSVAFNQATTRLSTITALDESSLAEGLIYVGTDDGLVQVTEDGGKTWRKANPIPGLPEFSYVTDLQPSARDANVVFATFNNWQRGDYKPYVMKSGDRGQTWTSIAGDLPPRSGVWSIVQDPVNDNLLFAGLEFGVYLTLDGGSHWIPLEGGIPTIQARDLTIQRREEDLVVGTFGRGVYILDDYTALREVTPLTMREEAWLFPLRDPVPIQRADPGRCGVGRHRNAESAVRGAFHLSRRARARGRHEAGAEDISDEAGKEIRRITLPSEPGLHRAAWDLRGEPPALQSGRGGRGEGSDQESAPQFGRGRQGGPIVSPGRYRASIGKVAGENFTAIGESVSFAVVPLPR